MIAVTRVFHSKILNMNSCPPFQRNIKESVEYQRIRRGPEFRGRTVHVLGGEKRTKKKKDNPFLHMSKTRHLDDEFQLPERELYRKARHEICGAFT